MKLILSEPVTLPSSPCPSCGSMQDRATTVSASGEQKTPCEGDFGVCLDCAEWLVYNADLSRRNISEDEIAAMAPKEFRMMVRTRKAILLAHRFERH